jgi:HPt (histidine-containing phosphotransfer) domain-containing protein
LVATFFASGEQQLAAVTAALVTADRAALARAAHQLKGACANINAHTMRSLAEQLEADSAAGDVRTLHQCNVHLRAEFERVKQFLSDPSVMPQAAKAAS